MNSQFNNSKKGKIIYWIATLWLSLGMTTTGIVQIMKIDEETKMMTHLGYPVYLMLIIGVWKLLGVVAVLIPKFPLLKEWAYAGFFFVMSGALISHLMMGDHLNELFPPLLLILLTVASWHFRPGDRKVVNQ